VLHVRGKLPNARGNMCCLLSVSLVNLVLTVSGNGRCDYMFCLDPFTLRRMAEGSNIYAYSVSSRFLCWWSVP
jgi:hypothetical protein